MSGADDNDDGLRKTPASRIFSRRSPTAELSGADDNDSGPRKMPDLPGLFSRRSPTADLSGVDDKWRRPAENAGLLEQGMGERAKRRQFNCCFCFSCCPWHSWR